MKQILIIIIIIILAIASGLVFWAGLSPETFSKFFTVSPVLNKTANQIGLLKIESGQLLVATTSEPVTGKTGQIIINGIRWGVEIANTDNSRVMGLSNRKTLYRENGMLFVFDKMEPQSFWMKDMLLPIDMIFFDDNWKIVLIESNVQPGSFPKAYGGSVKSQYVLEINALEAVNNGLKVGDQALFLNN